MTEDRAFRVCARFSPKQVCRLQEFLNDQGFSRNGRAHVGTIFVKAALQKIKFNRILRVCQSHAHLFAEKERGDPFGWQAKIKNRRALKAIYQELNLEMPTWAKN